ncbi:MAG TPA: glycerate kinase [Armatimonadota bacterium]|nr:glycerate kinase [Armatimonadota bacterium]
MRIVVAPDSFKGSLTALEACRAVERGLRRVWPDVEVAGVPMADGGEGTTQSLVDATGGRWVNCEVTDPLGRPVWARYGILGDGATAVIEMAAASGLPLVPEGRRDPKVTSTRGTGELIAHALDGGCRQLIVGIGGSATNDGGAGMAQALGARLLDAEGQELRPGGAELVRLERIDIAGMHPAVRACRVMVACDVTNPLCGPLGASAVYGPQKGASPSDVDLLDAGLQRFADVVHRDLGRDVAAMPGAGAAGGLGAGLVAFLGAELAPGVEIVARAVSLDARIAEADLVITGEGRIDAQTGFGKTVAGVAAAARRHGVPAVALCGSLAGDAGSLGLDLALPAPDGPMDLAEAMGRAEPLLADAAERVARALALGTKLAPAWGRPTR